MSEQQLGADGLLVGEPQTLFRYPIGFTGDGGEYFRIWLVNLVLSVLTIGLYAPWAKVRSQQYFYRHTLVDGSAFFYHGRPLAILKGRLVALVFFIVANLLLNFSGTEYYVLGVWLLVTPWMLHQAIRFKTNNSGWRGLCFFYHGELSALSSRFFAYFALTVLSCGLALPWCVYQFQHYVISQISFGGQRLHSGATAKAFYKVFLTFLLFVVVPLLFCLFVFVVMSDLMGAWVEFFAKFFVLYIVFVYLPRKLWDCVLVTLKLNRNALASEFFSESLLILALRSALLLVVTLGLYWPYAKVKMAKYRAETLTVVSVLGLDLFFNHFETKRGVVGEEVAQAFGLNLSD